MQKKTDSIGILKKTRLSINTHTEICEARTSSKVPTPPERKTKLFTTFQDDQKYEESNKTNVH